MDPRSLSLTELRQRLREAEGSRSFSRWVAALREDPRNGARALAGWGEERLAAQAAERARLRRMLRRRNRLMRAGARRVAGVDEVGMGPLAGPVVAAAVILPRRVDLAGVDDSKRLSAARRELLADAIRAQAEQVCIAEVWPEEIDRLNIYRAGLAAMARAVLALQPRADHLLVDARTVPGVAVPQTPLIGGDARDAVIAAASIVAKVHRDALMQTLHARFPVYGFDRHMGYATADHLAALERHGPCAFHRRSFAPCRPPSARAPAPRRRHGGPAAPPPSR